jgi:hypothetical protein
LQGLGIDPTSNVGGMRKSRVDEAIGKVLAANKARTGEKERVANVALQGIPAISSAGPGGAGAFALNIRKGAQELLGLRGDLAKTGATTAAGLASTGADLAKTRGNIATQYGQQVVTPTGELGASMLGTALATGKGLQTGGGATGKLGNVWYDSEGLKHIS